MPGTYEKYSGGIYYQNLNSQLSDFNSIKSDINRLNPSFNPTNLFGITYDNVPAWSSSLFASFQIILASSSSSSYVLLKYTSCISERTFLTPPGIYYTSTNGRESSINFYYPCYSSNVNLTGTWVFDVSTKIGRSFFFHFLR